MGFHNEGHRAIMQRSPVDKCANISLAKKPTNDWYHFLY
ncbi:MAG: hypothetical protein ACI87Q_000381 [Pseudohongiellaceae bacterium]|jgi:hypothetical protein